MYLFPIVLSLNDKTLCMRKLIYVVIILLVVSQTRAQSLTNGTLGFQIGYDFAAHGTLTETEVLGIIDTDTGVAVTNMLNIGIQYSFASWFSAGAEFNYGAYVEDTADTGANGNVFNTIAFDARLYPLNKDHLNWYVGAQAGLTNLQIYRVDPATDMEAGYKYASPHLGLFTGINWYFLDVAGLFFQLDYSKHGFELNELTIDEVKQDLTYINQTLDTKGVGVRAGITFHIN